MGGTTARIECTDSSTQTDRFVSDDAVVALRDVGEEQRAASTSPTRSLRHVGNGNGKAVLPTATSTCAEFRRRWRVFSTSSNSSEDDTTTNTSSRGRSMPGDSLTLINRTGSLGGGMNPWGDPTGTAAACAASGARGNSPWGDYRSAPLFSGRWRESADGRWERVYYASDDRTTSAGPSSSYSSSSSMSRREMAMRLSSYCCSGSSRTTSIGQLMTAHL